MPTGMPILLAFKLHCCGALRERQIEVREHDMTRGMQQDVLGLEVAVHKALQMQVLQGYEYLQAEKGCVSIPCDRALLLGSNEQSQLAKQPP